MSTRAGAYATGGAALSGKSCDGRRCGTVRRAGAASERCRCGADVPSRAPAAANDRGAVDRAAPVRLAERRLEATSPRCLLPPDCVRAFLPSRRARRSKPAAQIASARTVARISPCDQHPEAHAMAHACHAEYVATKNRVPQGATRSRAASSSVPWSCTRLMVALVSAGLSCFAIRLRRSQQVGKEPETAVLWHADEQATVE